MSELLLVSGSPRRRELLNMIAIPFEVFNADIEERRQPGEAPAAYAGRLAREKAQAGVAQFGSDRPALGADTIVVLDGDILEKPRDRDDARAMLARLSGATHQVYSAVCVVCTDGEILEALNISQVTMGRIPQPWIDAYVHMDEPMDKAGAYAIQGVAAQWVAHIDGSYSGVMGLPVYETGELLRRAGVKASSPAT